MLNKLRGLIEKVGNYLGGDNPPELPQYIHLNDSEYIPTGKFTIIASHTCGGVSGCVSLDFDHLGGQIKYTCPFCGRIVLTDAPNPITVHGDDKHYRGGHPPRRGSNKHSLVYTYWISYRLDNTMDETVYPSKVKDIP